MSRPVPLRGVIEGFYGPVWSHVARLDVIDFVGARGMNAHTIDQRRSEPAPPFPDARLA